MTLPRVTAPLHGRNVVVTRSHPGRLATLLRGHGADVLDVPTIEFVDPDGGNAALDDACAKARAGHYDWIVVTSPTGARRLQQGLGRAATEPDVRVDTGTGTGTGTDVDVDVDLGIERAHVTPPRALVAAIGPGTAAALGAAGMSVTLVPHHATAEALVAAFPNGSGRVLQIRPAVARNVIAPSLRAKGWHVDEVVAYRTIARTVDKGLLKSLQRADAITFTSPSTVHRIATLVANTALPPVVVSIGPVTSRALVDHGITPTAEADPHSLDGLANALVDIFAPIGAP